MAQHDYVIANGTGAAVRSDLNNALSAIVSNNSGATEPTPTYAYQWWADTTTGLLKIRNAANNAWVTVGTLASANLGLLSSGGTVTAALGSASTPGITFTGDTNTGIYSPGADQVAISTNGTGRLFVDSSGNITINGQGDLRLADSDSSNWVAFQAPATVASNVTWTLPSADGSASQVLSTDGAGTLSWASPSSTQISQGNTSAAVIDTGSDGRFVVTTEGTERARIDSSGRLLVGTSSAVTAAGGALFQLTQNQANWVHYIANTGSSGNVYGQYIQFSGQAPNNTTSLFFTCQDSSAERLTIRSNGGIANYSANNANLSDRNAKKDISPAADTWDCIKEWEIVNYRYKDQPDDADLNLGVIAQQVAESCPEVITVFSEAKDAKPAVLDDEGNEVEPAQEAQPEKLGIKEQQMYWMAIKALQEAQVRIEQLETEKTEQQTVLDDLLARVAALEAA